MNPKTKHLGFTQSGKIPLSARLSLRLIVKSQVLLQYEMVLYMLKKDHLSHNHNFTISNEHNNLCANNDDIHLPFSIDVRPLSVRHFSHLTLGVAEPLATVQSHLTFTNNSYPLVHNTIRGAVLQVNELWWHV